MASDELRRSRLQRAKNFAVRAGSRSRDKISNEELAAIKKKADDLDAIQKSVSDAAALGAPLWLSYIFLLFYIAIAAGAVTHKELLLESPVDLPFLNIKLPLKAFFIVAPILFLIVHAYVLAHFAMLSDKAKAFHGRLTAKITAEIENDHAIREGLRQQLPINVFVQFLAGPTDIRESAFGVLLWVIAWTTLVGAPVLVLLLLQLQFLPYHDTRVTWLHRVILCADLGVIWWLWMKVLAGRDRSKPKHLDRWMRGWDDFLWLFRRFGAQLATALVAIFSVLIATFPGEWEDWPFRLPQKLENRIENATEFVFGKVDALSQNENERVTGSWPANSLRLSEFDLYAALGVEGPDKLAWRPYSFSLKDRHLEHADLREARLGNIDLRRARLDGALLDRARLEKADLTKARLLGASLVSTQLQGASLNEARLQGATIIYGDLQGACLREAQLQNASLSGANLQGALLEDAQLQHALLEEAHLQGASLERSQLEGASLDWAELPGASLANANLKYASLNNADLRSASLAGAELQESTLVRANLQGSSLNAAGLQGASFVDVELQGASLVGADLQGALLVAVKLQGASLAGADLRGASLSWAQLQGASFTNVQLQGASLEYSNLWRVDWGNLRVDQLKPISDVGARWEALSEDREEIPWTSSRFFDLKEEIKSLPDIERRKQALDRIRRLDCKNPDKTLAACAVKVSSTPKVKAWQAILNTASVDYPKGLAASLRSLVCDDGENGIHILRGIAARLTDARAETPALVDHIMGPNCSVSRVLTEHDMSILLQIKNESLKEFPPAPASAPPLAPTGAMPMPIAAPRSVPAPQ